MSEVGGNFTLLPVVEGGRHPGGRSIQYDRLSDIIDRVHRQEVAMTTRIFICYRRDDVPGAAGHIYDRLEIEFGRDQLCMDIDTLPPGGVDFRKVIHERVVESDVFLAFIGPNWLGTRKEDGTRRLDSPDDHVRIEIAAALKRNIRVIPVLLDGARIPTVDELPDDLKGLARRQALHVRSATFRRDLENLISGIKYSGLAAAPPGAAPPLVMPPLSLPLGRERRRLGRDMQDNLRVVSARKWGETQRECPKKPAPRSI
jgi:hypothetical protein